jgi:hypothetical protein
MLNRHAGLRPNGQGNPQKDTWSPIPRRAFLTAKNLLVALPC